MLLSLDCWCVIVAMSEEIIFGDNLFGYTTLVREGNTFLALAGDGQPKLQVGMQVTLLGDSRGYVPSGFRDRQQAQIVGFAEPFKDGRSDHIIQVRDEKQDGWVKPSNIDRAAIDALEDKAANESQREASAEDAQDEPESMAPARLLELPIAKAEISAALSDIWETAEIIGALSSDDYRWSFTSILLALLYTPQHISRWFLSYATSANIRLADINGTRGFQPEQLPNMRAEFARGGSFLKKTAFTSSARSLFQNAVDLSAASTRDSASRVSARHLLGAYIYRLPSGHADQLREWGFVPADWSTNFIGYLSGNGIQESFWSELHSEKFGASAPGMESSSTQQPDAVTPFDMNGYSLSLAQQAILKDASKYAAACNEPISTSRVLLAMAEHGRPGRDPQWAGAFLRESLENQSNAYAEKIMAYRESGKNKDRSPEAAPQESDTAKPGLVWTLKRAAEIAAQTSSEPIIKGRHLLAALVTDPPRPYTLGAHRQLEEMGIDLPLFRERLYNWVRGYGDNDIAWRAVLIGSTAELLRRAGFDADNATGTDLLQIEQDVVALATLIAARESSPPLSIGLFGNWGSGKTFFMGQLKRTIAQLAAEANDSKKMQRDLPFYKRIVQIEFNAWHYVEGNLWASLVEHILDNLHITEKQTPTATESLQKHWIEKLGFAEKTNSEADSKAKEASDNVSQAEREMDAAARKLSRKTSELQELSKKSVARDFNLIGAKDQITKALEPLGLKTFGDAAFELESSLRQAKSVLEAGNATFIPLIYAKDKKDRWRSLLLILLGAPLGGALIGLAFLQFKKNGIAEISGFATGAAGLLSGFAAWIRKQMEWISKQTETVREAQRKYDSELARELAEVAADSARTEQDLALARQEYAVAQQRAEQARRDVERARSDLAAATTSRLLGQYIQDRAESTDYRKHLGVLAVVREDFQKLSRLIEEDNWRLAPEGVDDQRFAGRLTRVKSLEEEEKDLATRINRIVLYIDDLDRCPPAEVVKVLQAVHLLLAFPLFVVVVGVDARWISRSLEARYRELLHFGKTEDAVDLNQVFGVARGEDYLEKIFQIPLWLRPMDAGAARRMVQGLLRPAVASGDGRVVAEAPAPLPKKEEGVKTTVLPAEKPSGGTITKIAAEPRNEPVVELVSSNQVIPNVDGLLIADSELLMIDQLAPLLGRSPRSLKRFVNLYRLIKARLTPSEHKAFTRKSDRSIADYEAVLFLLAVDTGLPRVSRLVFDELIAISREPNAHTVDQKQFIERLARKADSSDWDTLRAWIEGQAQDERFNQGVMRIAAVVEQVSRYSFQTAYLEKRSQAFAKPGPSGQS
jgi:hypothetical protein